MKLELKHLAGYLPYELKGNYLLSNVVNTTKDELRDKLLTLDNVKFFLDYATPILRPLSDLTKEIEVNDEKFVPIIEYDYLRFDEISTLKGGCNAMKFIQVRELELLYEWHFDIHGLIENNLAIDINKIIK